jgi:hypothetical protein
MKLAALMIALAVPTTAQATDRPTRKEVAAVTKREVPQRGTVGAQGRCGLRAGPSGSRGGRRCLIRY